MSGKEGCVLREKGKRDKRDGSRKKIKEVKGRRRKEVADIEIGKTNRMHIAQRWEGQSECRKTGNNPDVGKRK
jgi:hypothetical protein